LIEKTMKGKERKTKFCPKCGSTDIFFASGLPQMWSIWDCRNCGYRGAVVLEDSVLADKLKSEWDKEKTEMKNERDT
jgi:predicted RNA-binding Zn-ribbon protein involved in translation (DUF1610 family)